jgi:hypothetical protein
MSFEEYHLLGYDAFARTEVLEENVVSLMRVTRISELGTTLAVTSNRSHALLSE